MPDDISIIIRVKNEERWIGHSIQSCLDFFEDPEIIIVDNESVDRSIDIAKMYKHDPFLERSDNRYCSLKVIKISNYTPGLAISKGVSESSREHIMLLSSHCEIKQLVVSELFELLSEYPALFGQQIPRYFGKRIRPKYIWSHFNNHRAVNMYSDLEKRLFFHNAASCFRRQFLIDHPFDEELMGKEDRYWAQNIVDLGFNYLYYPDFKVDHHYTSDGNSWKSI